MKILVIYQLCSFGGVERVLLNRAKTFRKYHQNVKISVGYLHDYGALASFQAYIHINKLDEYLSAFLIEQETFPDMNQYDFVFNIDTPHVFAQTHHARNIFVECHTSIVQNRQYLRALPKNVRGLLVPSNSFKSILKEEFELLPPISVLPNPVTEEFFDISVATEDRIYSAIPLAYLARLDDELKNFSETARIFELFANDRNIMFAIVGRGAEDANLLHDLEDKMMIGKTFLRSQIDFDAVADFVKIIKSHRGILVSSSRAESFGLSAAEFISAGVPVLLSNIGSHAELVDGDDKFLYPVGEIQLARDKITKLLHQWDEASQAVKSYGEKFSGASFIRAWQGFLKAQANVQ